MILGSLKFMHHGVDIVKLYYHNLKPQLLVLKVKLKLEKLMQPLIKKLDKCSMLIHIHKLNFSQQDQNLQMMFQIIKDKEMLKAQNNGFQMKRKKENQPNFNNQQDQKFGMNFVLNFQEEYVWQYFYLIFMILLQTKEINIFKESKLLLIITKLQQLLSYGVKEEINMNQNHNQMLQMGSLQLQQ